MKKAVIVASRLSHQMEWAEAFKSGLERHGWKATIESQYSPAQLVVFWGTRKQPEIKAQRDRGGEICILERGYVGDRHQWTSVSFGGGLNGRGRFYGPFDDASRWNENFANLMQPWRELRDGYVLILGQVPTDMSLRGTDGPAFWKSAKAHFERKGYKVKFRPHPLANRPAPPIKLPPLEDDLAEASFAVAWNSNSTVDAVLAGVPAVTMDQGAMAWDVTGHELAPPPMPDRTAWAHALAWKQWRREEIASGLCWDHARQCLEIAAA